MLRPIGSLSPAVYWRRRLLFVGAVLLTVLTVYVVFVSGDDKKKPAGAQTSGPTPAKRTSTPAAVPCVPSVLSIAAQTQAKRYQVGQQPELEIQVTNTGQAPCVANLSDSQIELLVYNGESRVWGSHDCQVQPGATRAGRPGRGARRRRPRGPRPPGPPPSPPARPPPTPPHPPPVPYSRP